MLTELKWLETAHAWPGLRTVVRVESEVYHKVSRKTTAETRYYLSSLAIKEARTDISRVANAVRGHWGIEASLHWSLDVSFGEDRCRVRKGYADQNLSAIRKISLNLLRADQGSKVGIKTRRMKAGWDNEYLKRILNI